MIVMFLVALAVMTVLIGKLNAISQKAEQLAHTAGALLEAKNVLLGYIRTNGAPNYWGLLPLPDMGKRDASAHSEGESPANFGADATRGLLANGNDALLIGRLPGKSLGSAALRDNSGNCLWYAISAAFKFSNGGAPSYVPSFNWDTLGDFETGLSGNPHDSRAAALIFAPGAPSGGQLRTANGLDSVGECGGNYVAGNYLENLAVNPANPGSDANQAVYLLAAALPSPPVPPAAAITVTLPANTDASTDHALAITASEIFAQIAATGKVQTTINTLLPQLKNCLETQNLPTAGLTQLSTTGPVKSRFVGPLPSAVDCSATITGSNAKELARWRDNFWYLSCDTPNTGCINLTDTTPASPPAVSLPPISPQSCDGAIVFAGARNTAQRRASAAQKSDPVQYLESALDVFSSAAQSEISARREMSTAPTNPAAPNYAVDLAAFLADAGSGLGNDIALCLKRSASANKVELDSFADVTPNVGGKTLIRRDIVSDIVTLGDPTLTTGSIAGEAVGCTFSGDTFSFGGGARFYFRFKIADLGDGFVFALIDAERNVNADGVPTAQVCGGAGTQGQFLGYASRDLDSASQLLAPPIEFPKIGLEFDTARNNPVGDTTNAHLALVYWGRSHDWPDPQPASPYEDDNTHGAPTPPQAGYQDPFASSAFGYPALRNADANLRDFLVRYEIARVYDPALERASYQSKVWITRWDQMIPGMDNLDQDFASITSTPPNHADTVYIYNLSAGIEAFRQFRLGFTNAQSSRRQQITIQDLKARLR